MDDKSMYIPNNDKQMDPFYRLNVMVEKIGHWKFEPMNRYLKNTQNFFGHVHKSLGTSIIYSPKFPPSLIIPDNPGTRFNPSHYKRTRNMILNLYFALEKAGVPSKAPEKYQEKYLQKSRLYLVL